MMMTPPQVYYEQCIKGKTKSQIMKNINSLRAEIRRLKNALKTPGYDELFDPISQLSYNQDYLELAKQELKSLGGVCRLTEEEQKAEQFDASIPAISKIIFLIGGYCDDKHKIYTVNIEDDGIYFYLNQSSSSKSSKLLGELYELRPKEYFLYCIKNLRLGEWERYYSNSNIIEGTQWELTVEFSNGQEPFKSGGSNAYPFDFEALLFVLEIYN